MARDPQLSEPEVAERMAGMTAWQVEDGALHRALEFTDFAEAFAFMTRVAAAAEELDHHPDWSNSWNKVVVDIVNHAAGGLTDRCFKLAAAVDEAAAAVGR
jgi:4a-hydroxytetrahydrobiopterin dehydratase